MKSNLFFKKVTCLCLAFAMMFSTFATSAMATESDDNISTVTSITSETDIKTISINVGEDKSELNFTWLSTSDDTSYVQTTKDNYTVNNDTNVYVISQDTTFVQVQATQTDLVSEISYYSYKALVDSFDTAGTYYYRVGNNDAWSEWTTINIGDDDNEYTFILAGDPQIGSSDATSDGEGWANTLNLASSWFGNEIDFLVSVGDQVNASRSAYAENEYDAYFTADLLANIPSSVVAGNHEAYTYSTYSAHFTSPSNVDSNTTTSVAGDESGDYWYAYEGTLFMSLNSNDTTTASHRAFMEQAIADYTARYGTPTWQIVTFHHSIYSSASHYNDSDIVTRRETWADMFSEFNIDAVLMGHDHVYTRSVMMTGMIPTDYSDNTDQEIANTVVDPADGAVLYLTANSASGSKYYSIQNYELDYVAVKSQENTPNITKVDVSDNALVFTTYRTGENNVETDIVDQFTIARTTTANSYDKPEVTGATYTDIHAPVLTVPEDSKILVGDIYDVTDGVFASDYDYVNSETVDVTSDIVITGDVDTTTAGIYAVTYTVSDVTGNTSIATVTVTVREAVSLISTGSVWSYLDDNTDPADGLESISAWTLADFDYSAWQTGVSPFGAKNGASDLGNGFTATTVINQYIDGTTTNAEGYFFKTTFDIADSTLVDEINGTVVHDDQAIVYLNGNLVEYTEISSSTGGSSSAGGPPSGSSGPSSSTEPETEVEKTSNLWYTEDSQGDPTTDTFTISDIENYLVNGTNILSVELHNNSETSSDIYFDMTELTATMIGVETVPEIVINTTEYDAVALESVLGLFNDENSLNANLISGFSIGGSDEDGGLVEIVAYNTSAQMAYVVSGSTGELIVIPMSELTTDGLAGTGYNMQNLVGTIDGFTYGDMSSVAVSYDSTKLAVALQEDEYTANGLVAIFDLDTDGNIVGNPTFVSCGVQPDALTFTPDSTKVLVANEGEPRDGYGEGVIDPEGSVTIVDVDTLTGNTVNFDGVSYDENLLLKTGSTPSEDFEPEFIATTNTTAYVALQENNAIAILDLATSTFTGVYGLGLQDFGTVALDMNGDEVINLETYQGIYGIRMPDGISLYEIDGTTYLFTANEGDGREWGEDENEYVNEEKNKTSLSGNYTFESKVTWFVPDDYAMLDQDADYLFGARSFSIFAVTNTGLDLVFDSASDFETIVSETFPEYFNCSNDDISFEDRTAKKGVEPEYTIVGEVDGKIYAFTGLERQGGIMMYDVTDPANATFVNYLNSRDYSEDIAGDVAPEGMAFVKAEDSATGEALLLVANEVSGTMSVIELTAVDVEDDTTEDSSSSSGSSSSGSSLSSSSSSSSSTTTTTTTTTEETVTTATEKFNDIDTSDWYATAVEYVTSLELFNGTSDDTFSPDDNMTRQMVWTVIGRLQGKTLTGSSVYEDALEWAVSNGVSDGTNPTGNVTREQLVVILWRAIGQPQASDPTIIENYTDNSLVSDWAVEALAWAVENGIINGMGDGTLSPEGLATRAQVAQIITNYCN